jgi:cyanophycinase
MAGERGGLLFLIGGTDRGIVKRVAEPFVAAAGGEEATVALLLMGGEGWEGYVPRYMAPWEARGVRRVEVIVPKEDGKLDLIEVGRQLGEATGIFIGGGHTARYHELYATEPVRSLVRERHQEGVPVAGLSAGAMIAPQVCLLRPSPRNPDECFRIVEGLGLVRELVVEVHFTEGVGLGSPTYAALVEGMARMRVARGLGIGPGACAVLREGKVERVIGTGVWEIRMTDFEKGRYSFREIRREA